MEQAIAIVSRKTLNWKTSRLSQYLYTLAIPDKNCEQWKFIMKLIFKLV